jgi:hypothetical protein
MFGISHSVPILGAGDQKNPQKFGFVAGTYIGLAGATARIINTQAKKVHAVWASKERAVYSTATTNALMYSVNPCKAAGTPSSFYLIASGAPTGASFVPTAGIPSAATFKWLALVEE